MIAGDATDEQYEVLRKGVQLTKGVPGLTCEIGVRGGKGSVTIMKAGQDNDNRKVHIGIDPWGNIEYHDGQGIRRIDYTNAMKRSALRELYKWAALTEQDLIILIMKDTEFFELYSNGVPIHNQLSTRVNEYAYVYTDGPHHNEAVQTTVEFFEPRTPIGGVWQFDNTNQYDHNTIHQWILAHGFESITAEVGDGGVSRKQSYQRRSQHGKM